VYHVGGIEFGAVYRRRPSDFVFTFLRDGVDIVYSNFAYMKARVKAGDHIPRVTPEQRSHFRDTLEKHVDNVLRASSPDNSFPQNLDLYDFVGIAEEMTASLEVLTRVLRTRLENDRLINSVPSDKTYRRAELRELYAPQTALYELARKRLLSGAYDSLRPIDH
jgi:hypothetical protein